MVSELRARKLARLFHSQDSDRNGYLDASDYDRLATHFALTHGHQPGTPHYAGIRATYAAEWEKLRAAVDSDGDDRVALAEYVQHYGHLDDLGGVANQIAAQMLAMMDRDGDGKVSRVEYVDGRTINVDEPAAAAMFRALDRNGDGYLTLDEVLQAVHEFFTSEDPAAPGNNLLGPLS